MRAVVGPTGQCLDPPCGRLPLAVPRVFVTLSDGAGGDDEVTDLSRARGPVQDSVLGVVAGAFRQVEEADGERLGLGGAVVGLIAAFPKALVLAVAGFALLGTIGSGLATAMKDERSREAALITFLVTASGLALWGVGSAFWGVVAGAVALMVQHWRPKGIA